MMINLDDDHYNAIVKIAKGQSKSIGETLREVINLGLHDKATGKLPGKWRVDAFKIGEQVRHLRVIGPVFIKTNRKHKFQMCRCVCGAEIGVRLDRLRSEEARSCGCLRGRGMVSVFYQAREYGITAACQKAGISINTVWYRRANLGETPQVAFDRVLLQHQKKKEITHDSAT
jgi:hypothetical protein